MIHVPVPDVDAYHYQTEKTHVLDIYRGWHRHVVDME
jgi:hypothetical protein